jgi:hypothetical protein
MVGLFGVVGMLAVGMLSAMLTSRGETWQSVWSKAAVASPPKHERRPDMPYIALGNIRSVRGCTTILPGEDFRVDVTGYSATNPEANNTVVEGKWEGDSEWGWMDALGGSSGWPVTITKQLTAPSSTKTLRVKAEDGNGATVEEVTIEVSVDTTTHPSFPSFAYDITNCDPLTFTARVTVNRADSWSYRLLDANGQEISGGTPNTPDTSGCSFQATVSGITGAARIEITATNVNGSTTQAFTLSVPAVPSASLNSNPSSIEQGTSVTLTWSTSDALLVSIDNGVGTVAASGSVTVSPTETTTYTLTAEGACATDTASVTITVTVPPPTTVRLPIAFSVLEDVRTPRVVRLPIGYNALVDVRTPTTARLPIGYGVFMEPRTPRQVAIPITYAVLEDQRTAVAARVPIQYGILTEGTWRKVRVPIGFQVLYPNRIQVIARNVATGEVLDLGTIDADASPLQLTDVAMSPGTYEVWACREGLYWPAARTPTAQVIQIADGLPPVLNPLPMALALAATVSRGQTTITWTASHPITGWTTRWGLWFGPSSPVDISGTPTARVSAMPTQLAYEATRRQTSAEYVAVAAIAADGTKGTAAELYLPWSTTPPASPVNQVARV